MTLRLAVLFVAGLAASGGAQQSPVFKIALEYHAPVDGQPKPNFSPKGTQVALTPLALDAKLPAGSVHPAKTGLIKVGPDKRSWIPVLVTADAEHPRDLTRLVLDRNRNGSFADDGATLSTTPSQNEKTRAWWSSISKVELSVPYATLGTTERYFVNFWMVREDSADAPNVLRYSTGSWRSGTFSVKGTKALIAVMDDNDAMFTKDDMWSAMAAGDSGAAKAVLTIAEARPMNRLMFVSVGEQEHVLEFRKISVDGRTVEVALIDRPVTKFADRAPDDMLRDERSRPRATVPFVWGHGRRDFNSALAAAKKSGRKILLDFEATWCGPCHTMDQWIWNDLEVAGALNAGYVGVKIDVDLEKPLVARFKTSGYPTMIILDSNGKEVGRVSDYQSSAQMLVLLRTK